MRYLDKAHHTDAFVKWMSPLLSGGQIGTGGTVEQLREAALSSVSPGLRGQARDDELRALTRRMFLELFLFWHLHWKGHGILFERDEAWRLRALLLSEKLHSLRLLSALDGVARALLGLSSQGSSHQCDGDSTGTRVAEVSAALEQKLQEWRTQALELATEMYAVRAALDRVSRVYFDGRALLFTEDANGLQQHICQLEDAVNEYNELVAESRGHALAAAPPVDHPGDAADAGLRIDLEAVELESEPSRRRELGDLLRKARSDSHRWIGEDDAGDELMRPVWEEILN